MRLNVQLYVDTSGSPLEDEPIYERVDLLDFESIELTSSRQEVRDISKIFTDYSQEFSAPANTNNNKIFKYYYNIELKQSFDARVKQRAYISINGITFKSGYIRLNEVSFNMEKPSMYKVVFFGNMVSLTDILGEDELSDLTGLEYLTHEYNSTNVFSGFTVGLGYNGTSVVESTNRDVVYPAISAKDKWFYDSGDEGSSQPITYSQGTSTNIANTGNSNLFGIDWTQLKPAIKLIRIIEAIESTYKSITFTRDFFSNPVFNELYLLLHNTKGILSVGSENAEEVALTYNVGTGDLDSEFQLTTGNVDVRPLQTFDNTEIGSSNQSENRKVEYDFTIDVYNLTPVSPKYDIEILDGETLLDGLYNLTADATFNYNLSSIDVVDWDNLKIRVKGNNTELTKFDIDLTIERTITDISEDQSSPDVIQTTTSNYDALANQTTLQEVVISKHFPKIKVIDFLKGIFNMFNLTSQINDNGEIEVKPLDNFYDEGSEIDITKYVDTDSYSMKRMKLFSDIKFKFQEPSTYAVVNQNELANDEFGDLNYSSTEYGANSSLIFDGGKYEVKLPFEKMLFETLSDEANLNLTTFSNGWLVDDNEAVKLTKPLVFFNINTAKGSNEYAFEGEGQFSTYNRPSNFSSDGSYTINFGAEREVFNDNGINRNSLFEKFYKGYVNNIFDKNARILSIKAHLPLGFLLTYGINDTLVIRNREYIINNIRTDLTTGKSDIELLTKYRIILDAVEDDLEDPTTPTNFTAGLASNTSIPFSWTESTDDIAVTGYKIYYTPTSGGTEESVAFGVTNTGIVTGLAINTSYDFQIVALDAVPNESTRSAVVTASTTNIVDTQAPTTPTSFSVSNITGSSISLTWNASTDNVAVTGYEIEVDGGTVTDVGNVLTYQFTGLTLGQTYNYRIRAYDAAGNKSSYSSQVSGTPQSEITI